MRILIKFPSRGRPDKLRSTFLKYVRFAEDISKISFLISLDEDDSTVTRTQQIVLKKIHPDTQIIVGKSCGKIGAVNRDMDLAPPYDILLLASDDMIPEVKGYDRIIREKMTQHYPDTDGVLWFNDGFQKDRLNTLSILGKKYYDRFGYIYHPSYKSLWCDNEFTEVATKLGKQTYFEQIIIKHEHPLWTKETPDTVLVENDKYDPEDRANFERRKKEGLFLLSLRNSE
uniref:Glycosyltransferase n=1 Tax=viral metagenome TaxID=1070528 RepID=A0A6C0I7A2_9ZZZZ